MIDTSAENVDVLAKRIGLPERARDDARQNRPDFNAPQWDGVKSAILPEVKKEGEKELRILSDQIAEAHTAIENLKEGIDTFRQYQPNDGDVREREAALQRAEAKVNETIANYNVFRKDNGLIRDASDDDRMAQVGQATIVVIIESVANGVIFQKVSEGGLLGGVEMAIFISVINVGFAFLGGVLGLRYFVNHCDANKKLLGFIWLTLCLAVCLFTVSLSAWFRAHLDKILEKGLDNLLAQDIDLNKVQDMAWKQAFESMQDGNIALLVSNQSAFLLLFFGLFCAIIGLYKGYKYDDPYPGFGDMFRAKEKAETECNRVRKEYEERKHDHRNERRKRYGDLEKLSNRARTVMGGLETNIRENAEIEHQLTDLARNLLDAYLRLNGQVRSTQAPASPEGVFAGEFGEIKSQHARLAAEFNQLREGYTPVEKEFAGIPRDA